MAPRLRQVLCTILWALASFCLLAAITRPAGAAQVDRALEKVMHQPGAGKVEVIVTTWQAPGDEDLGGVRGFGGEVGPPFRSFHGFPARVPAAALVALARSPRIKAVSLDAEVRAAWDLNAAPPSVGIPEAKALFGATGAGVGVAIIDSGSYWHDDLWDVIDGWADFYENRKGEPVVWEKSFSYDPYGHGTHVAGILAGTGKTLAGFSGVAPGARLQILKVLGSDGTGSVSRLLRAIDWVRAHAAERNIRVVNLSLGHPVYESYTTDPLCVALETLVRQGIVVVAAAGNYGRLPDGTAVYGSIVSPAHSPHVITVGAMNPLGTPQRSDDIMATFSSRGPTFFDGLVKPDVVAPGVYTVSGLAPGTYFDENFPVLKIDTRDYGVRHGADDYFVLSGTSMAAPVVSGIAALMLEKNPSLTPNLVKAILQHTAEDRGYDVMTQGAGYVNAPGALEATVKITSTPELVTAGAYWLSEPLSGQSTIAGQGVIWVGQVLWGSSVLWGGAGAVAFNFDALWDLGVLWGGAGFDYQALSEAGISSQGVIWVGVPLLPQAVIWTGLPMADLLFGEASLSSGR
jgi:serine protease AprX